MRWRFTPQAPSFRGGPRRRALATRACAPHPSPPIPARRLAVLRRQNPREKIENKAKTARIPAPRRRRRRGDRGSTRQPCSPWGWGGGHPTPRPCSRAALLSVLPKRLKIFKAQAPPAPLFVWLLSFQPPSPSAPSCAGTPLPKAPPAPAARPGASPPAPGSPLLSSPPRGRGGRGGLARRSLGHPQEGPSTARLAPSRGPASPGAPAARCRRAPWVWGRGDKQKGRGRSYIFLHIPACFFSLAARMNGSL